MKAVILAGGLGTRLRPVTGEHPKPMVPLLGRPVMEHIVELLRKNGYTQICAALHYRAGEIMAHFGDGRKFGVSMEYRIETENLGTAGSVKNCRDFYKDEDFLVISADAACDYDLGLLMQAHRARGGADEKQQRDLSFPGLTVSLAEYDVHFGGKKIEMPPKELEVLYFLASHPNQVFTREQLLSQVWGFDFYGDSRTVDVHIKRLREKLEGSEKYGWSLYTVRGVGYKFSTND